MSDERIKELRAQANMLACIHNSNMQCPRCTAHEALDLADELQARVRELEQQVRNCHTEIAQVVEPSEASCDCDFCEEGR